MSYAIYFGSLSEPRPWDSEELTPTDPDDPDAEVRKQAMAEVVMKECPSANPFPFDFDAIASSLGCSLEEARRKYRHIELTDEKLGLQVTVYDTYVALSLAFWHQGKDAAAAFDVIRRLGDALRSGWDYLPYDSRLDADVNLSRDLPRMRAEYERVVALTMSIDG